MNNESTMKLVKRLTTIIALILPIFSILIILRYRLSNVAKSIIIYSTVIIILCCIALVVILFFKHKHVFGRLAVTAICFVLSFVMTIPFFIYLFPQKSLDVEFVTSVSIAESAGETNAKEFWYCSYSIDVLPGVNLSETNHPDIIQSNDLDYDRYTYLFSYGYEINNLQYNLWDIYPQDKPIIDFGNSRHFAKVSTKGNYQEGKLFVYRLKKVAVQNIYYTKFDSYEEFAFAD